MLGALTMNVSIISLCRLSDSVEILSATVRIKVQLVANPVLTERDINSVTHRPRHRQHESQTKTQTA